ncbi:cysteinyl-tRNA synthetase [Caldivirga maquilingensis IC-167]|uniref:Cysteine--tRNA ligase n=1 Tax=Caldivirga maquilingensis (strain ATCC 700844 / DSM 13496 / JCM 10307 / IC-167) TaxID=397948 RepID=A8MD04_CALMQ|nr:cysteinyl-tRNA synthetase [Caldivirga maquilingensis IC-167]
MVKNLSTISKDRYIGAVDLPIMVFNTATKMTEQFRLMKAGVARGYVCGLTPYDEAHVGHARVAVFFDLFRRYLEYLGINVRLVTNFTDIDDKIIEAARKEFGDDLINHWYEVPSRYIKKYLDYMDALYVKRAYAYPKVTENVQDMVKWIDELVRRGNAYVADGSVYFDVTKVPNYGEFSGQRINELIAGARVEPEPGKRNPLDFALWKAWKPNEPWWDSPWGPGRPGWHLECVVMSSKYLGVPFDFHGGGQDLVFPHHENEIAIAKVYYGLRLFARYWIHVGLVNIGGEKMSKSLGNIIPISDVLSKYDAEAVRLYFLNTHYRKPIDFSFSGIEAMENTLRGIYASFDYLIQLMNEASEKGTSDEAVTNDAFKFMVNFENALNDDFNTPAAVSELINLSNYINSRIVYQPEKVSKYSISQLLNVLSYMSQILGVLNRTRINPVLVDLINTLIKVRQSLRERKLYDAADLIREELGKLGIVLGDYGGRTYWFIDRKRLNLP